MHPEDTDFPFPDELPAEYWRSRFAGRNRFSVNDVEQRFSIDLYATREDIDNSAGMWTPAGRPPMRIEDMETEHIINIVALIWRVTAVQRRNLQERPHSKFPRIKLKVDNPEEKIREFLKELKKRDALPTYVRVR